MTPQAEKKLYGALSFYTTYAMLTFLIVVLVKLKSITFPYFVFFVIFNFVLAFIVMPIFDVTGINKKLWKFWNNLMSLNHHKYLTLISILGISFIAWKALIPVLKKEYDK